LGVFGVLLSESGFAGFYGRIKKPELHRLQLRMDKAII